MKMNVIRFATLVLIAATVFSCSPSAKRKDRKGPRPLEILFLGHASEHHNSALYMPMLASALSKEGINFSYTDDPNDLNEENLSQYDGLMIYANHDSITADQEKALLEYVANGHAFLPVHSASFCFQNSPKYIDLVGGQFQKHDTATFIADIVNEKHPIMQGVEEFSKEEMKKLEHLIDLAKERNLEIQSYFVPFCFSWGREYRRCTYPSRPGSSNRRRSLS